MDRRHFVVGALPIESFKQMGQWLNEQMKQCIAPVVLALGVLVPLPVFAGTEDAKAPVTVSAASASDEAASFYSKGQMEAKNGRLRAATEAYVQAIRAKPDFAAAYLALGRINHEAGRPEKAMSLYRLALQHDPELVEAYQGLGNLHFDQNRLEEAVGFYQEVVKRSPTSPVGYNSVGNCYYGLQKFQEALEMWQKAVEVDPTYPRAYFNRAILYDGVHDKDKAIANYRKFIELAGADHVMLVEDARMRIEELERPESEKPAASAPPQQDSKARQHQH
jgi:tetratricopeptide (TPR) repeat protein